MRKVLLASLGALALITGCRAQDTGAPPSPPAVQPVAVPNDRSVSLREMIPNVVDDQRRIWTFPAHITHHHNWIPVVAVLGVTASLVATDGLTGKPFATTDTFHGFNSVFNSSATTAGILAAPAALYTVGLLRHDSYASHTALLAAEALADSEVVVTALKTATRRERPEYFSKTGNFSDSFFENPGGYGLGHGGFPSGHAIAAFSVATVVSRRYGKTHRWVPYAAYGVATAIGFSRVTSLAHFPSDVFFGAALGYSVGRFAVLR